MHDQDGLVVVARAGEEVAFALRDFQRALALGLQDITASLEICFSARATKPAVELATSVTRRLTVMV